jgi:nucleoside-diphosphate-sugar epimerase
MIMRAAGKTLSIRHIPGPTGVRGRNSDNRLIRDRLGWAPSRPLSDGLAVTYRWIERQVYRDRSGSPAALASATTGA